MFAPSSTLFEMGSFDVIGTIFSFLRRRERPESPLEGVKSSRFVVEKITVFVLILCLARFFD